MKILIASDIFGETEAHIEICELLGNKHQVTSISPYHKKPPIFANETEAYQYFINMGGMDNYLARIANLKNVNEIEITIGFSAGGAAIWACQNVFTALRQGIAFYPGQIRHYLETKVSVPWHVVFAKFERHFDQDEVIGVLAKNTSLSIYRAPYQHGFINPDSEQFNLSARREALDCLANIDVTANKGELATEFTKNYEKFGNPMVTD